MNIGKKIILVMFGVMKIIFKLDRWEGHKMLENNYCKLWKGINFKLLLVEKIIGKLEKLSLLVISFMLLKKYIIFDLFFLGLSWRI